MNKYSVFPLKKQFSDFFKLTIHKDIFNSNTLPKDLLLSDLKKIVQSLKIQ